MGNSGSSNVSRFASRSGSASGLPLPSSPADCVQRLRSYDKRTSCGASLQIATREYTKLHSVAQHGGTTELIRLFNSTSIGDQEITIHFLAITEMISQVPGEVHKLASNIVFMDRIISLYSSPQSVFKATNGDDMSIFIIFTASYLLACNDTKIPIESAFSVEQRKKLIALILPNLASQSYENVSAGLAIVNAACVGICAQTQLHIAMQKTVSYLVELPFGPLQVNAHHQAIAILTSCAEEITNNVPEWFAPYSSSYLPKLINLLARQGKDTDFILVIYATKLYIESAAKYEIITKDGKFIVAWANLVALQEQPIKDLKSLIYLLFLAHTGVPHLQTAFAVLSGSFSIRLHEKQQKFLVILSTLLFSFAELDTEENAQKLVFIIDNLESLYGTPQMTINKLVLISELLVAVQKKTSLPERECTRRLEKLIPVAIEKLKTLLVSSSPDIKSVQKLIYVICTSEEYLASTFTTSSMKSLLTTLLQHRNPEVVVSGFTLLDTWTLKTDWTVWSPVVISTYLPIIAQKLSSPNSPVFSAAVSFLRYNISTLHQAQQLLPPSIHHALAKGCVSLIPQTTTMFVVFVDMLRIITLIDTTKKVLATNGAITLVVEQYLKSATSPTLYTDAMWQSLINLFVAIDEEIFAANPPWQLVLKPLFSISPDNFASAAPFLGVLHMLSARASCALLLAKNEKVIPHLFNLLNRLPMASELPYRIVVNILWNLAAWGHISKQMLPDRLLSVLIRLVDPSQDELLRSITGLLWDLSYIAGIHETVAKNHYAAISTILRHLQTTPAHSRFTCCGLLGKLTEKGLLLPPDADRALKFIHELAATPPGKPALDVVFNHREFQTCLASWMAPNTPLALQELLLWTLVSFKTERENLIDSLQSALAHGTLVYALQITLNKKPPPLLHSLALQHISFVWAPTPNSAQVCALSLRKKSEALAQKNQPVDSDFALEDINRVEAAHIKELSSHPANSEGRKRVQALVEYQYEFLDEFAPPHTQSQIIALCLRSKSTPLAPLVISIGCKKEPSPSEYGQLSATLAEWKRKFAAGRKVLVLSLQPFFVQSMLKANAKVSTTPLLLDNKPNQPTSTSTSLVVRQSQTQLITTQFNSISLASDPALFNPKASLQRCSVCSLPLRGVTESSLRYADVTTSQQMCPACARSRDKIEAACKLQNSGSWQDAFLIWEELSKSNQGNPFFFTQMAFCAFKCENYENAHTAADRAVKMKDEDPSGHLWNIFYYSKLGTGRIIDAARIVLSSSNVPSALVADIRGQVKMVLKEEINFAKSKKALPSVCDELSLEATTLGIDLK